MSSPSRLRQRLAPLRGLARALRRLRHRADLCRLAELHGTDKWGRHFYAQHYATHFAAFRRKRINLLEIGVGGYSDPRSGGASLRMWKDYFPKANIFAVDVFDKSPLEQKRIRIFQGSQDDPAFLAEVVRTIGRIDIIVDDGSHINAHVLKTFDILFDALADGGLYVIEDLQTAYWPKYGGSEDPDCDATSIAMCKQLIDGLNWEEFFDREPQRFDRLIRGVHFYHNIAFIEKGRNVEGSNRTPECRRPRQETAAAV